MDPSLRAVIRSRAGNACEYRRIPQEATPLIPFHVEHIVSRQHGGTDDHGGLALDNATPPYGEIDDAVS
jgi:hypothetical protein